MKQNDIVRRVVQKDHKRPVNRHVAPDPEPIRKALDLLRIDRVNRVSVDVLRQWRNGTRAAPHWFISLLGDMLGELESRASEARKSLAAYPGGPGRGAPLRTWWKARKDREITAQTERERKTEREQAKTTRLIA